MTSFEVPAAPASGGLPVGHFARHSLRKPALALAFWEIGQEYSFDLVSWVQISPGKSKIQMS